MSFNFGSGNTGAKPAASGCFSFGTAATTQATTAGGFSFGAANAQLVPPSSSSGGFRFGGAATSSTPAPASTGFSFRGLASTTPATQQSSGFSFGGPSIAATPSSASTPATTSASTGFSLGGLGAAATSKPAPSFNFGGATATAASATSQPAAPTTGGFSLGGAKPAAATQPNTSMDDTENHLSFTITSDPEHINPFLKELHSLQQSGTLTDFTLKSGSQSLHCHKVVLAASCTYFSAMLRSDMKENVKSEASLDNIDFTTLDAIVQYCYTGSIVLEYCNLKAMVQACDFLQIQQLKEKCEKYLIQELNSTNCLSWCKIGSDLNLTKLMETIESKMCNEFSMVTDSDAFCELDFAEVVDCIRNPNITVLSEDSVLETCFRWISWNISSRKQYLPDFLKHITIRNCSSDYLNHMIKRYENIIDESCRNTFYALTFRNMDGLETMPNRNAHEKVCYALFGGQTKNANDNVRICSTGELSQWKSLQSIPSKHVGTSICQVEDECLSTGGGGYKYDYRGVTVRQNTTLNNYTHIYHSRFNGWTRGADMPTPRSFHASVSLGKLVYVMGGKKDNNTQALYLDTVEAFDIDKNIWQSASPMPQAPGVMPITAKLGMTIYLLLDTCDENKPILEKNGLRVLMYNTARNKWTLGRPLPESITDTCGARALGFQESIYLVGGAAQLCNRFRPESNTWENLTPPMNIRSWSAATTLGNRIVMLGGSPDRSWQNGTNSILEYDVESDKWSVSEEKCPYEFCCGFVAVMKKTQSFLDKL